MKRLTKRNDKGHVQMAINCPNGCEYFFPGTIGEGPNCKGECEANAMIKLCDYEDAEEQGLLLRLLCKVGDTVYYPVKDFKYVYPVKIEQIIISNLGDGRFCTQYNGIFYDGNGDPDQEFEFDEDDFEKNVFLSQAEAEQALADSEVQV